MDGKRFFIVILSVGAALAGCARDLDPPRVQTTTTTGSVGDAGSGTPDARIKADGTCNYDVDAVPVSTENSGDSCLFAIVFPSDPNFSGVHVVVDGVTVPQDVTNGWTYTDATQRVIQINGPTCDAIKAGTVQTVWLHFYCTGIN